MSARAGWLSLACVAVVIAVVVAVLVMRGTRDGGAARVGAADRSYAIGVWGDLPYTPAHRAAMPALVADMNAADLAFTVHDGDLKDGGARCDDATILRFRGFLDRLRAPALYTPGDNEWTDCDRPSAGGFSSRERLAFLRRTFFARPRSRGRTRMRVEQQAPPTVENLRWQRGGVTYATLHVVGSDNNRSGAEAPDPVEFRARDAATNRWLRQTFARARRARSAAVVLVAQADPGFGEADGGGAPRRDRRTLLPRDGFHRFLVTLRSQTLAFGRPVLLVHGDTHQRALDQPLHDADGERIEAFTRLETAGGGLPAGPEGLQWTRVRVDPDTDDVFAFEQRFVAAPR